MRERKKGGREGGRRRKEERGGGSWRERERKMRENRHEGRRK